MKIHGLLPFLRKFVKNMNLRELAGQTAAIDASCWLHKGLSVSFAQTGRRDRGKENLIRKAAEDNISPQEANKLRSQAAEISFDDITKCINIAQVFS